MMSGTFKKIYWIICMCFLFCMSILHANAVDCQPPFNGNWIVWWDCSYSRDIKVFGDITVWPHTISVPDGVTLGIDLSSNRVTFTSGKVLFAGGGKMDNSVSTRNFIEVSYSVSTAGTGCPNGYSVLNTAGTVFQWGSVTVVPSSGIIRCGKL